MEQGVPVWTPKVDKALHFARRRDAELFCAEDEDAWYIYPIVTSDPDAPQLRDFARALVRDADRAGLVLSVWQEPLTPLAMGHYVTVVDVREALRPAEPLT